MVKESLRYEVTTAKIDDEFAEQARSVLILGILYHVKSCFIYSFSNQSLMISLDKS